MSNIQSKMISFPANGGSTPGYLAQPVGRRPFPRRRRHSGMVGAGSRTSRK
jgi:hypothetical protein